MPIPPGSNDKASPPFDGERGAVGAIVFGLFFVSGAAGLVYQVIWLRQLTLVFGATAYASSAVLSTFMGGLALGSWWAGRRADRWTRPALQTYALLELSIAGYAAAIPWLLACLTPLLEIAWHAGASRSFVVLAVGKFAAIAILILPATTLMGATLPVLSRLAAPAARSLGGGVGALYAANTFGAVFGTIFAAFVALPAFGVRRTLIATVAVNAIVGLIAWIAGRRVRESSPEPAVAPGDAAVPHRAHDLIVVFAISGAAAMVLEVAWTRGLALVLGSSVYAYASMLTAFLVGLATGAASAVRFLERRRNADPRTVLVATLGAAGLLSFGTAYAVQTLPRLFAEIYFRLSPPPEGWWLVQLGLALLVMFPTTFALGWVFPLVLEIAGGARAMVAASVGRVYAANTLGTIVGAAAGGFVLIPWLGVGRTLVGVAALQLLLGAALARGLRGRARTVGLALCLIGAAACLALRPSWDVLLMNSGVYMNVQNFDRHAGWTAFLEQIRKDNTLLLARDGLTASVLVADQPRSNNLYLTVNGKTDASSREDLETQIMVGQLPMLLHPAPHDVLVIGLASGISVGSVASHPVDSIRVLEVEAAMMDAARLFGAHNGNVLDDPRVTVSINDARNELQFSQADYDVIVSEPSNPWMTVAANLFTDDFFQIARTRLRPGGVFGQWIQAYCLAPEQVRSILAGFRRAFPHVLVFETLQGVDLLLVGSDHPLVLDAVAIDRRMRELRVGLDLARIGIRSATDIAGLLQTGGEAVTALVAGSKRNTDDNGYVEFSAPKALYLDSQAENLAMLQNFAGDPLSILVPLVRTPEAPDALRLALIRRWLLRDQAPRARRAADFFSDPASALEARRLLETPE